MASSRKRSSNSSRRRTEEFVGQVAAQLAGVVRAGDRVAVALSGGLDSMVLLDVLHRLRARLRLRLSALHVNHQLSPNAPRWSAFCRRACRDRGIPFRSMKVTVARGDSLEAAARGARYEVFSRQPCDYIVLAHHQDDQVETLFLQLLRGAGVKGLAAMPVLRVEGRGSRDGGETAKRHSRSAPNARPSALVAQHRSLVTGHRSPAILRPLLDVTRQEILKYAQECGLEWVEDESNADVHFQRNFLRHQVLPEIARRFPAYRATVARTARHLAETAVLLDEMAAADGAGALDDGTLAIAALRRLSPARARNLLRHFLAARHAAMPNTGRLDEALRQVLTARRDARVAVDLGAFDLRQYEDHLHVVSRRAAPRAGYLERWQGERELQLPELGGVLVMAPARGTGLSLARLREHPVAIRTRTGGERLQPDSRRPRRTLKNLLQEAGIPPWERERLPLVFCGGDLAWVPAIGVDCAYQAAPGERSVSPSWRAGG